MPNCIAFDSAPKKTNKQKQETTPTPKNTHTYASRKKANSRVRPNAREYGVRAYPSDSVTLPGSEGMTHSEIGVPQATKSEGGHTAVKIDSEMWLGEAVNLAERKLLTIIPGG